MHIMQTKQKHEQGTAPTTMSQSITKVAANDIIPAAKQAASVAITTPNMSTSITPQVPLLLPWKKTTLPPSLPTTPILVNRDAKDPLVIHLPNANDELSEHIDPVNDLLKQAEATAYCRPVLKYFGYKLPADDSILTAALNKASEERNAKAFTNLYVAALLSGRRIGAEVLERGAVLLPEPLLMLFTPHRLDGDVANSIAVAVRSGRMSNECAALAVLAGWEVNKRRDEPVPPEFLALTRKVCRQAVSNDIFFVGPFLHHAAILSRDPVVANILTANPSQNKTEMNVLMKVARVSATHPGWEVLIPYNLVADTSPGSVAALQRVYSNTGRNEPCPCGSGKKFKHCCGGQNNTGDLNVVQGVSATDASSHPELILTEERIETMLSHELYALDPKLLAPDLAEKVALNLVRFHEFSRAIEVLQEIGREAVSEDTLNNIALGFFEAKDDEALRWIINWAPEAVEVSFEMGVFLAAPDDRLQLLCRKARDAFEAERSGDSSSAQLRFNELGVAALLTDPALGIVVARGVLRVCGPVNQGVLIDCIEDARDILCLVDNEPGRVIVNAASLAREIEDLRAEMSTKVASRDAENCKLRAEILSLRETFKEREDIERAKVTRKGNAIAPIESGTAEIRELRDKNRRLNDNFKAEHEELNRMKKELEAVSEQLRRANHERTETQEPKSSADHEQEEDDTAGSGLEPGWQAPRTLEFGADFMASVWRSPVAAYTLAGRLADGDPSAWNNVCPIKKYSGMFRAEAGNYRLIFEIRPGDILHCVDLIRRRDLETWLKNRH